MIAKGEKQRVVRETEYNSHSSRSHTIVLLEYSGYELAYEDQLDRAEKRTWVVRMELN